MAERRMFAKSITNSARFLRMPGSARLLYYDLGMAADDDGVVEAFTVLRISGTGEGDLQLLAEKGFVTILNDDLVTYINDWKQNNQIRPDRYNPSVYAGLLDGIPAVNQVATDGIPVVNQMATDGKPSIGKVRSDKDSIGKDSTGKVRSGKSRKEQNSQDQGREGQGRGYPAAGPPARALFAPPGVEEVKEYCVEQGLHQVDPARFVDHYTANGWMVGKTKMKDWQAAVRNWASRELEQSRPQKTKAAQELDDFYKMAAAFAEREDL